jgi:alpha-1,2-glucosyltransferase
MCALIGVCAVFVRQTNIIWVALVLVNLILNRYEAGLLKLSNSRIELLPKQLLYPTSVSALPASLLHFIKCALINLGVIFSLEAYLPFILVLLGFVGFVIVNGGIVVGDKSNHTAIAHFPQILYFLAFAAVAQGFSLVSLVVPFIKSTFTSKTNVFLLIGGVALSAWFIRYYTYGHPFLLADNRHYTFYLWRLAFQRNSWSRYALIPLYVFGMFAARKTLGGNHSLLRLLVNFLLTVLMLVPSPLVEFRYFLLPTLYVLLHSGATSNETEEETKKESNVLDLFSAHAILPRVLNVFAYSVGKEFDLLFENYMSFVNLLYVYTVNVALLYVFIFRPFTWSDGTIARFMW